MEIRSFREEDLEGILRIERLSFRDPWPRTFFSYISRKAPDLFLVAEEEGAVLGYVIGEVREVMLSGLPHRLKMGHIVNIAVAPERRRSGIGSMLMLEVERRFRERKATRSTLEVRESNSAARSFYKNLGYEETGRVRAYYLDEDAIIMTKNLA
ncbi:ribosomal protein S18-alanine N-acetyltransferase [Candidatus Bathyarchaeota archaeon]|nr:ribosomal protein S18-alanine N-acetyltransferase [Candidatus Bathyarchaeota archaeon]